MNFGQQDAEAWHRQCQQVLQGAIREFTPEDPADRQHEKDHPTHRQNLC